MKKCTKCGTDGEIPGDYRVVSGPQSDTADASYFCSFCCSVMDSKKIHAADYLNQGVLTGHFKDPEDRITRNILFARMKRSGIPTECKD